MDRHSTPKRKLCFPFCQDKVPLSDSVVLLLMKYGFPPKPR